jgi:hypothetical protein
VCSKSASQFPTNKNLSLSFRFNVYKRKTFQEQTKAFFSKPYFWNSERKKGIINVQIYFHFVEGKKDISSSFVIKKNVQVLSEHKCLLCL